MLSKYVCACLYTYFKLLLIVPLLTTLNYGPILPIFCEHSALKRCRVRLSLNLYTGKEDRFFPHAACRCSQGSRIYNETSPWRDSRANTAITRIASMIPEVPAGARCQFYASQVQTRQTVPVRRHARCVRCTFSLTLDTSRMT